ncbi:MAG TPA: adenosylcobinamide-GDP ribazoletransferase [Hyphomicrobium sp.]
MIAQEAKLFLIALQFLTRIPLKRIDPLPDDWLPRSAKYMPLVGALIGVITGAIVLISSLIFPWPVPIVIGLASAILLTGALHEDGLADTVDAFGAGASRERCLEIMKDSRIGTYGTLALIATLALKGTALAQIDPVSVVRVLIAAYAGARLAAVSALALLPYAGGDNAKVSRATSEMTRSEIAIAIATGLIAGLLVLGPVVFLLSTGLAALAASVVAWIARRKIGGYAGDVLGAIEQIYEMAFVVCAVAIIAGPG